MSSPLPVLLKIIGVAIVCAAAVCGALRLLANRLPFSRYSPLTEDFEI